MQQTVIPVLESVEAAGFVAGSQLVYSAGETGRLRLWWATSGKEATEEQPARSETQSILDVIGSSSLPFLLCVLADQTLVLQSSKFWSFQKFR